jgi:pyruvate dehydrogenase E1 component alpha subunit
MRREHDAIEQVRRALLDLGVEEQALKATDDEIKKLVAEAAEFAQSSPEPDPSELWTDVLVEA